MVVGERWIVKLWNSKGSGMAVLLFSVCKFLTRYAYAHFVEKDYY